ncbi:MAG: hypothetical protein EBT92_17850 [Planctomycetes bacterium]|nr:hypothetical protein [Planctomycetota bacterium]
MSRLTTIPKGQILSAATSTSPNATPNTQITKIIFKIFSPSKSLIFWNKIILIFKIKKTLIKHEKPLFFRVYLIL